MIERLSLLAMMRKLSPFVILTRSLAILISLQAPIFALQTAPFRAGQFTNAAITDLAKNLGGEMGGHLDWFANTAQLFTFPGHDGLPLQGYYIPATNDVAKKTRGDLDVPRPVIIHCAGWSESTIKYSKFLHILHGQGYPIYSFDMRGQGFSSATGCHILANK